jgi:peptide/nickel transport system permease protein
MSGAGIAPPVGAGHAVIPRRRGRLRVGREDRLLVVGLVIIALSVFLSIFGAALAPYDPTRPVGNFSAPPSADHWFGTDNAGLDVFSRVLAAPRVDVAIAVTAAVVSCIVGTLVGLFAGFYRGAGSFIVMRVSDTVQAFPVFILAMTLVALSGRSIANLIIALSVLYTTIFVRLTYAEVRAQRERSYVEAARAMGNSELRIALRHVLPNSLGPSLVQASVTVGFGILLTAGLSFVGAGVRPPTPEWGLMIATGAPELVLGQWWTSLFPGIAISITVFGYAAVGNALERQLSS